jgi:primosomal protein N'
MDADTPFPERDNKESEKTYKFSKEYFQFFGEVYDFARNIVEEGEREIGVKRRMKFWSALALLRSVTSSPAAAESSLRGRIGEATDKKETEVVIESEEELNSIISPLIEDTDEESPQDSEPSEVIRMQEEAEKDEDRFKKKFREFAKTATSLKGKLDTKLQTLFEVVDDLVANGYHPIIWCRYIATAEYIKLELTNRFKKNKELVIGVVTGKLDDEERKEKIEELQNAKQRILVATDCLSEGINLQKGI